MSIGIIETGHRRATHYSGAVLKTLKDHRRLTRSVMQRYEGQNDLTGDETTTYEHLTLSMVILNALSEHIKRNQSMPKSWDVVTLGSDFDRGSLPLLQGNAPHDLWVAYFEFDKPRQMLEHLAGEHARKLPDDAVTLRPRPTLNRNGGATTRRPSPQQETIMELIRTRMPKRDQTHYTPQPG